MDVVKLFYDMETTGLDPANSAIHQMSGQIEVNGKVVEEFDLRLKPFEGAEISESALKTGEITREEIMGYPDQSIAFKTFHRMISKYIDPYDKSQGCFLIGFNNSRFDDAFLHVWFKRNQNKGFLMYFWPHAVDVMALAGEYLLERRYQMKNFKLATVAEEVGIVIDKTRLHEAGYDIFLTKKIYNIVTGREEEW